MRPILFHLSFLLLVISCTDASIWKPRHLRSSHRSTEMGVLWKTTKSTLSSSSCSSWPSTSSSNSTSSASPTSSKTSTLKSPVTRTLISTSPTSTSNSSSLSVILSTSSVSITESSRSTKSATSSTSSTSSSASSSSSSPSSPSSSDSSSILNPICSTSSASPTSSLTSILTSTVFPSSSSSFSSTRSSSYGDGGWGDPSSTTIHVSHGHTAEAALGAFIVGGVGGGFASFLGKISDVAEDTVEKTVEDKDGNPEEKPIETSIPAGTTTWTIPTYPEKLPSPSPTPTDGPTPTPTDGAFLIIPISDMTLEQQKGFQQKLDKLAMPGTVIPALDNVFKFWVANLTVANALIIQSDSIIESITNDEPFDDDTPPDIDDAPDNDDEDLGDEDTQEATSDKDMHAGTVLAVGEIKAQSDQDVGRNDVGPARGATKELIIISKPASQRLRNTHNYYYKAIDPNAKSTIYILDGGANVQHPEYVNMPGNKRFLWPNYIWDNSRSESDPAGHGSCVYSLAMGPTYGTAKLADAVIVKLPYLPDRFGRMTRLRTADIMLALNTILTDVQGIRALPQITRPRFVVNMSLNGDLSLALQPLYAALIKEMIDHDIVIVCSSGNERKKKHYINTFPAVFGTTLDIIVVGAVDNKGRRAVFSQGGPALTTTAPGVDVVCASGRNRDPDRPRSGTSMATAKVSGVVAGFLSDPQYDGEIQVPGEVSKNVKAIIKRLHYKRSIIGSHVIWNGITVT